MLLKIGELAKRTGLTVRTLHHYDAIGLLAPSARSDSGYRLYNRQDIERLHRIQALRRLDLSLNEIAALLKGDSADLKTVIQQQIVSLDRQVMRAAALRDRLTVLLANVNDKREPDLSDWLVTLEMMSIYDKYFTREEVDSLCSFDKALLSELTVVVSAVRSLMARKVPPGHAEAQALAKPWLALSVQHMNDDARLLLKLEAMHRHEEAAQAMTGVDNAVLDYMSDVTAEFRLRLYGQHLGADEIARVREDYFRHYRRWPGLFAELRQLRDDGADPLGPQAQDLCLRWIHVFQASWGSDPTVREKVLRVNQLEPDIMLGSGLDSGLLDFLGRAAKHLREQQQKEQ